MKFIVTKTSEFSEKETEVEIASLEELIAFAVKIDKPIILTPKSDSIFSKKEHELEIYDDYRD